MRLYGVTMSRRILLTTLTLVPVFFLIVLGMRNPALEHNHLPKQRPRAVVEAGSKAQVVKCCDHQMAVELAPPVVLTSSTVEFSALTSFVAADLPAAPPVSQPSRASPSLSPAFS